MYDPVTGPTGHQRQEVPAITGVPAAVFHEVRGTEVPEVVPEVPVHTGVLAEAVPGHQAVATGVQVAVPGVHPEVYAVPGAVPDHPGAVSEVPAEAPVLQVDVAADLTNPIH
jgi:hypothetical protein